eukprot:7497792-Pyramimonas_sp.AAC.1
MACLTAWLLAWLMAWLMACLMSCALLSLRRYYGGVYSDDSKLGKLVKQDARHKYPMSFDVLIIDEAQDLTVRAVGPYGAG